MNIGQKLSIASSLAITLAMPALASVTINSPVNGAEVQTPFKLSAVAVSCASESVAVMGYSLDGSPDATFVEGTTLEASVVSAAGTHTLHVKAWGGGGAVCVTDTTVTVTAGVSNGVNIPSDATTVSHLQTMGNWRAAGDKGAVGRSTGSMAIVSSPSIHGSSRRFITNYKGGGDERYSLNFGDDTRATHFFYDAYVYLTSSAGSIANLEMDMNQVMPNGWTVTYGVQCDGYSGTWDYTANTGTPKKWHDHWLNSRARCNPRDWSREKWHHVQVSYSRDDAGKVTYHSVWLDGVESKLNVTVPSAFALGWGPDLITNFQIDGLGAKGSNTVYLDSLTISRW